MPKIIAKIAGVGIALLVFLEILIYGATINPQPQVVVPQINFMVLVNQDRSDAGLPPLTENELLVKSATAKACDMLKNNYFAHTSPTGVTPWYFIREAGYSYITAGENIAKDIELNTDIEQRFMASEKHRDNILNPRYTEVGVGKCGEYTVQHFGRPYENDL